ncbi:nucleotidyltransferase family protein [Aerophototrophica crusticola]|uniref:nucleotidyltransferase family protein n=1 Tax=Aerophototrophica crusticola TaxID=1709002 RepID=UPI00384E0DFC
MGSNKLLAEVDGVPLVTWAVDAALASQAVSVTVVTGNQEEAVRAALTGRDVAFVRADDHAQGLSASLKAGLATVPDDVDGVVVLLGDMPRVTPAVVNQLIAAYAPAEGRAICIPTHQGRRGNPILWDRQFIPEMLATLSGDTGARSLLNFHADRLAEVEVGDDGILLDVDTPEALAALRGGISAG